MKYHAQCKLFFTSHISKKIKDNESGDNQP